MPEPPNPDEPEPIEEPAEELDPAPADDELPAVDPLDPPPRGAADPVVCPLLGREPACWPPPPRVSWADATGARLTAKAAATMPIVQL